MCGSTNEKANKHQSIIYRPFIRVIIKSAYICALPSDFSDFPDYLIQILSSKKKTANTTLAIPLVVINAKLTRLRSLGFTSRC